MTYDRNKTAELRLEIARHKSMGIIDSFDEVVFNQLCAADDRVAELESRLEISPDHPFDGIYCRDETIRLLEKRVAELEETAKKNKADRYAMRRAFLDALDEFSKDLK